MPSEIQERIVRELVRLAEADLQFAALGADARLEPALVGFHAQQAVEKLLKAALITHDVDPEDTHDLARLAHRLRLLDREMEGALAGATHLTPYAVHHRYPGRTGAITRVHRVAMLTDLERAREIVASLRTSIDARLGLRLTEQPAGPATKAIVSR